VELLTFVEGVVFAAGNTTFGSRVLKSMNSSLRICCWTASGTGGSDSDTDGSVPIPEVAAAGDGLFETVNNASLLVPCGHSGGACDMVKLKLLAEPFYATEKTGGELMERSGRDVVGIDSCYNNAGYSISNTSWSSCMFLNHAALSAFTLNLYCTILIGKEYITLLVNVKRSS